MGSIEAAPARRRWSWFGNLSPWLSAVLLGALCVPLASLAIAAAISGLYWLAYLIHLGAPPRETQQLLSAAVTLLEHSGALATGLGLLVLSRWTAARPWVVLSWQHSALVMAVSAWLAGLPFALKTGAAAHYPWLLALYVPTALVGTRLGGWQQALGQRLLDTASAIRQSRSPQALVEAIGRFEGPRVALFAVVEGHLLQPDSRLKCIADSATGALALPELRLARLGGLCERQRLGLRPAAGSRALGAKLTGVSYWLTLVNAGGPDGVLLVVFAGKTRRRAALEIYQSFAEQAAPVWRQLRLLQETETLAQRRERLRVSYQLHDTLTQDLISALMYLRAAHSATQAPGQHSETASPLAEAERIVRKALQEARRLTWDCYTAAEPAPDSTLVAELEQQVSAFSQTSTTQASFRCEGNLVRLTPQTREVLLAVLREALNNVRKHSGAEHVRVTLTVVEGHVVLDVCDDGCGGAVDEPRTEKHSGFGLVSLQQRVEAVGGQLVLESAPCEGSTLSVQLPVEVRA